MTIDQTLFLELIEALILVFAPFWFWWLVIVVASSVLSGIGIAILEMARQMTR